MPWWLTDVGRSILLWQSHSLGRGPGTGRCRSRLLCSCYYGRMSPDACFQLLITWLSCHDRLTQNCDPNSPFPLKLLWPQEFITATGGETKTVLLEGLLAANLLHLCLWQGLPPFPVLWAPSFIYKPTALLTMKLSWRLYLPARCTYGASIDFSEF